MKTRYTIQINLKAAVLALQLIALCIVAVGLFGAFR